MRWENRRVHCGLERLKQTLGVRLRACFLKLTIRNKLFFNSSSQKAAELSGVAGGFCCLSLHRPQISEDL
jgi:hypothetical protein